MTGQNPNQPPQNPGQIQPGWYPDPGSGHLRWWDGRYWGPFHGPSPANPRSTAALAHYLGILGLLGPLNIMLTNSSNDPFVRD